MVNGFDPSLFREFVSANSLFLSIVPTSSGREIRCVSETGNSWSYDVVVSSDAYRGFVDGYCGFSSENFPDPFVTRRTPSEIFSDTLGFREDDSVFGLGKVLVDDSPEHNFDSVMVDGRVSYQKMYDLGRFIADN